MPSRAPRRRTRAHGPFDNITCVCMCVCVYVCVYMYNVLLKIRLTTLLFPSPFLFFALSFSTVSAILVIRSLLATFTSSNYRFLTCVSVSTYKLYVYIYIYGIPHKLRIRRTRLRGLPINIHIHIRTNVYVCKERQARSTLLSRYRLRTRFVPIYKF